MLFTDSRKQFQLLYFVLMEKPSVPLGITEILKIDNC